MKTSQLYIVLFASSLILVAPSLHAQAEQTQTLGERLAGASFQGLYIRAGTPYTMDFGRDGSLSDSAGRTGRWWIDDQGQYCREWQDGPMAGVETCMEVIFHLGKVAIYSGEDKVLEGEIVRPTE
jgi:hypothetical protein